MASSRQALGGRRGWFVVLSLTLVLGTILGTQAVSAAAGDQLAPVAATTPVSPSVAVVPSPATAPTATPSPAAPAAAPRPVRLAPSAPAAPAAPAPPAAAADVCSGPDWQAKRGRLALSTLRDTGQRSGVTVAFKDARAGYLGLTYPARRHVDIFVRSCGAESMTLLRHVLSHEMGHAYDAAHMTDATRQAYLAMRGIPAGTPWFGCNYCSDFATPAGDFAEAYSQWQRGSSDNRTQLAPMPTAAQLAALAAAFFS